MTLSGMVPSLTRANAGRAGLIDIPARYHDVSDGEGGFSAPTATLLTVNTLYACPFRCDAPRGYNQALINVTTGAVATSLGRISILSQGTDGLPDSLIADSGTFLVDAIAEAGAAFSIPTVQGAWVWLCFQSNGAPTVFKYNTNNNNSALGYVTASSILRHYGVFVARAFGPIAASLTGTGWTYDTAPLAVRLRAI